MAINKEKFSLQNKIKYLISNPNLFFERIKNENTIKDAFLLDLIIRTFIAALLYFFVFSIVVIIGEDWNNYYSFIILPAIFLFFFIGILKNFILTYTYFFRKIIWFPFHLPYSNSFSFFVDY